MSAKTIKKKSPKKAKTDRPPQLQGGPTEEESRSLSRLGQKSGTVQARRAVRTDTGAARFNGNLEWMGMHPRLGNYVRLLARPFDAEPARCPVNYNPVPSIGILPAITTHSGAYSVAAGTTSQFCLFTGGTRSLSMDGPSYHSAVLARTASGINFAPAPVLSSGGTECGAGIETVGLTVGAVAHLCNTANDYGVFWDRALPFQGNSTIGGEHLRWKCVAVGVRIENETPVSLRGGDVTSAMPNSHISPAEFATQNKFNQFGTFRVHTEANRGMLEISWIPRPEFLAFWHSITSTSITSMENASIFVWLNNPTANVQNYRVQMIYHWEFAGVHVQSMSQPAILQPQDRNVLEPTFTIARYTGPTAAALPRIASGVAAHMGPMMSSVSHSVSKTVMSGLSSAAKALISN